MRHLYYTPVSFWEDRDLYVQMLVEKIDLKSLFCRSALASASRSPTSAAGPTSTAAPR